MERNKIPYLSQNCRFKCTTVFSLDNCDTITNLYDIADSNYFASIAETTKKT